MGRLREVQSQEERHTPGQQMNWEPLAPVRYRQLLDREFKINMINLFRVLVKKVNMQQMGKMSKEMKKRRNIKIKYQKSRTKK